MISEPRTIARIVELYHIPIAHDIETLRGVYLEVSKSCGYDNFIRQAGGARLESAASEGTAISRVTYSKDRITFVEEHANASLENFRRRMEEVISVSTDKLSIPVFVVRNITVRAVATAGGGQNAARFIADSLIKLEPQDLDALGRPGHVVGVRLLFPPKNPKGGTHQIRVESYLRDPRCIYLEDQATYKMPVQSSDKDRLYKEIQEADGFIHERVREFLNQFPRRV